ncbi:gp5 [Listeria phage P35]|uniref:gp5 n=1 Tax=Listeria phage P35 TaxID=330398 RepID=UPI00015C01F1|nr:gp5 [Listeria phage P35]AAY53190.1 gp5 [Listeria phage P35]
MPFYEDVVNDLFKNATEEAPVTAETITKALAKEFPLHTVPKQTLLDEQKKVKDYKETISSLEKRIEDGAGNEQLLTELQGEVTKYKDAEAKRERDSIVEKAIVEVGGSTTDLDYIKYKLGDVDLNDQTALTTKLGELKESMPKFFTPAEPAEPAEPEQKATGGYKVIDNQQKQTQAKTADEVLKDEIAKSFGF